MLKISMATLCLLLLGGCATNPYQKMGTGGTIGGYDETLIKPGQYRVTYQGQGVEANDANVYASFLHRCADLAKQNSAPQFKIIDAQPGAKHNGNYLAQTSIPNYTGTLVLLEKQEAGSFSTDEVLSRFAVEDADRITKAKKALDPISGPSAFRKN